MSTERDELRGTLSNTICNASNYPPKAVPYLLGGDMSGVLDKTADAILAAGYSKPRTITTAEELDALPHGVVVRSMEGTIAARYDEERGVIFGDERTFPWGVLDLPATVLWEPK